MKLSEAILKGIEKYPKQAFGILQEGDAACVDGCAIYGYTGEACVKNYLILPIEYNDGLEAFRKATGFGLLYVNDRLRWSREKVVETLQAVGH